jgi:hypothetical protein
MSYPPAYDATMRYLMLMWADADAASGDESDFRAWAPLRVPGRPGLRPQPAGRARRGHPVGPAACPETSRNPEPRKNTTPGSSGGPNSPRRPGPGRRGRSGRCGPGRRGAAGSGCSGRPRHYSSITMSDAGGQRRTRAVPIWAVTGFSARSSSGTQNKLIWRMRFLSCAFAILGRRFLATWIHSSS